MGPKTLLTVILCVNVFTVSFSQIPTYVPADGLIGWWPFNGNANDETGNGNNGTLNGGPLVTDDRNGEANKAYLFNGTSDFIRVPYIFDFEFRTISCWFLNIENPKGTSAIEKILNIDSDALTYGSAVLSINVEELVCIAGGEPENNGQWLPFVTTVSESQWQNVVLVRDGPNTRYFVNGVLMAQGSSGNVGSAANANPYLILGADRSEVIQFFNGKIDDVGVWNRALTASEVYSLFTGCLFSDNEISGPISPTGFTSETYTCSNTPGSTYEWSVTNGVIVTGQGTNQIEVLWSSEGSGSVSVVETNSDECVSDPVTLDVVVIPTSIDENVKPLFSLFPNPASTHLTLTCEMEMIGSEIAIIDGLGREVYRGRIVNSLEVHSLEGMSKGIYKISVKGPAGSVAQNFLIE